MAYNVVYCSHLRKCKGQLSNLCLDTIAIPQTIFQVREAAGQEEEEKTREYNIAARTRAFARVH